MILDTSKIILPCDSKDQGWEVLFQQPACISFNEKKQLICVSDRKARHIVTMTTEGKVQNVFSSEKWKMPLTVKMNNNELITSDCETVCTSTIDLTNYECKFDEKLASGFYKDLPVYERLFGCMFFVE